MEIPTGKQGKEFWRGHVESAANFSGSGAAYCRQNGLDLQRFSYHRKQILKKSKFSEVKPVESVLAEASKVVVVNKLARLPDPVWLATLIRELTR